MGRSPCCDKMGLKKGPWTPEEDRKLLTYIQQHGHGNWHALPFKAGLRRCGKSCRLRWANYLRPDIKRGMFSSQEDETIIQLHALLGNRWSAIAAHLPKRTDNEIKNYWNTHLKKRLTNMGIDPVTHKPKNQTLGCDQSKDTANISHMAQWESARLEAEARSKLDSFNLYNLLYKTPPPPPSSCLDVSKAWAWTNPEKDISTPTLDGFFASNGSCLQSPACALCYENSPVITNVSHAGMYSGGSLANSYHQDEVKGIMGNSMDFNDITNPNDHSTQLCYASSLGFPSFNNGGFTDVTSSMVSSSGPYDINGSWGPVLEGNEINYMAIW